MKKVELFFFAVLILALSATSCNSQKDAVSSDQSATSRDSREGTRERGKRTPPSMDEVFKMDSNNDGKLSKTEIKGRLLKDFDKIDTDKDGFISKEELKNAPKPKRGERPQRGN